MIISRTPFRISFFGGGTDYREWYREHGGSVLSTTIDKYCYISCRELPPFFEYKHRLVYGQAETVKNLDEIRHPTARAVLSLLDPKHGLEIHHDGDLPARSGLGSSSAFTVGLINALKAMEGRLIAKHELAQTAIHVEQDMVGETVGVQDQIAAAYGGLNRIEIKPDDTFTVDPVVLAKERKEEFGRHLMFLFTGFARDAPTVAKTQVANIKKRGDELRRLRELAGEGTSILQDRQSPLEEFGLLLHEGWKLKRSLSSSVSTDAIDEIYAAGLKAGALGGKLLGAGGGGFMLFFAPPGVQNRIRDKLEHLLHVPFRFETSGSKIVLYDPQGDASSD